MATILWEVWDPLDLRGVAKVPHEYDDFVPQIVALLEAGATESEIASALNVIYVTVVAYGQLPAPIKASARAAKAMVALRKS